MKKKQPVKSKPVEAQPIIKEEKKQTNFLKIAAYISAAVIILTLIVSGVIISIKAATITDPDQTMLTFVYILGVGWFVAILMLIPIIIARREVWQQLKVLGRKSRVVIFRIIGADANEIVFFLL